MLQETIILADPDEVRRDLALMTARWGELDVSCVMEVRAFKEGGRPQIAKFSPDWIDEAVDWVVSMNEMGFNTYVVRNPIRHDVSGSATDDDIVAAFFLWADCDEPASTNNVRRFDGPRFSAHVKTGQTPDVRVHTYWELKEPCTDLAEWRAMQEMIAAHFGSDSTVVNPSRIMRIGGTVAFPAKHKLAKGYIKELTSIQTEYGDDRGPVTLDQMRRVFGDRKPAAERPTGPQEWIDGPPPPMDRERAAVQALSGQEWNKAVLRLVGSYVRKGLSDTEIHALTDPLTLGGYTVEETRAEVQDMVDRTRANPKFADAKDQYAEPDFDAPSNMQKPHTADDLEWFDDIEPQLTDSYLIKGFLGAQAMSVIYGPSNSGKTFFALDVAYNIAIGAEWRGRRVKPAAVLYLAAEGGKGVSNRIAALRAQHGVCGVPFALKRAGMDLLKSEADLQRIYDLAGAVQARCPDLPLMIVIDTLSRVMAGGDENSAADMTALIRNIDAVREATGAHIMLVHHTGKDTAKGARGHSSLRAATDTEIEVGQVGEDGEECRAAMVTKQRDYPGGETFAFALKSVDLGIDQDGDDVTTCVLEEADSAEFKAAKKAKKGVGGNQKIIMDTFRQMIGEGLGEPNPSGVGLPERGAFWTVRLDDLRQHSMGKFSSSNPREAWRTAWKGVTEEKGLFCIASGLCWRIDMRVSK